MHKKKTYSDDISHSDFLFGLLNKSEHVFTLELLRFCVLAFFLNPLWSVELHPTQASSYKAVIFASKPQHCQRALQAPPLKCSLRDEKPAVDLSSVAVKQLILYTNSHGLPHMRWFD